MTAKELRRMLLDTPEVKVGDAVHIFEMDGEPDYAGREGIVEAIDAAGQLYGTWGEYEINPTKDIFKKI